MQEIIVAAIFVSAIGYLGWRFSLKVTKKSDCDPDCSCQTQHDAADDK